VRVLAVASAKRHPAVPDIPGMEESGTRDNDIFAWTGMVAPARTPAAAIAKLNAGFNAAYQEPDTLAYMERAGYSVRTGTPEEFGRYIAAQIANWHRLIVRNKIEFD
jgi:tripartite-type tricarboxylate transporter receptor subunit TctC